MYIMPFALCKIAYYAVYVIKWSSIRLSVRPSVCPVDRQQRPAGLLLRSGAGSRYRSIAAAAARHVNFGPIVAAKYIRI